MTANLLPCKAAGPAPALIAAVDELALPSASQVVRPGSLDEPVPRPVRDAQAVWHLVGRVVVAGRRRGRGPREMVVQYLPELGVAGESGIFERTVEAFDGSAVHVLVRSVSAVNPHYRGLVSGQPGVTSRAAECLGPVRG